ncbi:MAG: hypothetical protein ACEY3M_06835, partial [Wolbachia sp.]
KKTSRSRKIMFRISKVFKFEKNFSKIEDFLDENFSNLVYICTQQLKCSHWILVNKLAVKEFSC